MLLGTSKGSVNANRNGTFSRRGKVNLMIRRSQLQRCGRPGVKVRENANVVGRWHDNRHTLITELAESGAGDEVIMSIAGHVSRAMLSRYSHVRMEAKRRALDEIAVRQSMADEKRLKDTETGLPSLLTTTLPVVQ